MYNVDVSIFFGFFAFSLILVVLSWYLARKQVAGAPVLNLLGGFLLFIFLLNTDNIAVGYTGSPNPSKITSVLTNSTATTTTVTYNNTQVPINYDFSMFNANSQVKLFFMLIALFIACSSVLVWKYGYG